MLEVVWTRRAEGHIQRIFAKLDEYSPRIAESWLEEIGGRAELLARFPEMASIWRSPYRCSRLRRGLGLFYVIEGRRLIVSGIFPLSMDTANIFRRLEGADWL
jgi:plasmid stabilization system protein ParE